MRPKITFLGIMITSCAHLISGCSGDTTEEPQRYAAPQGVSQQLASNGDKGRGAPIKGLVPVKTAFEALRKQAGAKNNPYADCEEIYATPACAAAYDAGVGYVGLCKVDRSVDGESIEFDKLRHKRSKEGFIAVNWLEPSDYKGAAIIPGGVCVAIVYRDRGDKYAELTTKTLGPDKLQEIKKSRF